MSQFFSDVDAPVNESRKKVAQQRESSDEGQGEGMNKKEARIQALRLEMLQAEESLNNKSVDKTLRSLQKNAKFVDKDLPFVRKFFERVAESKKVSQAIKDRCVVFAAKLYDEGKVVQNVNVKKRVSVREELDAIVSLRDTDEKCRRINDLLENCASNPETFEILKTKLFILVNKGDRRHIDTVYSTVLDVCALYDSTASLVLDGTDLKKLFVQQIKTYLNMILLTITEDEKSMFMKIANAFRKYDESTVNRKVLDFKYFVLHESVSVDDKDFKLLYLVRNEVHDQALRYFEDNEEYLLAADEKPVLEACHVLGLWCFRSKHFMSAFKALQRCHYYGHGNYETKLLVLCCLLNHDVREERFFKYFLEQLAVLEKNALQLESGVPKNEIMRAFFFLMCHDNVSCEGILTRIEPELDCHDILQEIVARMASTGEDLLAV